MPFPPKEIFAFRTIDLRDRFPEPTPTFLAALEKLQSDAAYMPETGEIIAYLVDGRSIPIPREFYIRHEKRFKSRAEAEEWVHERMASIAENPRHRIFGAFIANPDAPIEEQIDEATTCIDTTVADASENPQIVANVNAWLRSTLRETLHSRDATTPSARKFVARLVKTTGVLLRHMNGHAFFRKYNDDGSFTDYDIWHSDLSICIDDTEAAIYDINGQYAIDHAPETLGFEVKPDT